jgi:hypothetical protein
MAKTRKKRTKRFLRNTKRRVTRKYKKRGGAFWNRTKQPPVTPIAPAPAQAADFPPDNYENFEVKDRKREIDKSREEEIERKNKTMIDKFNAPYLRYGGTDINDSVSDPLFKQYLESDEPDSKLTYKYTILKRIRYKPNSNDYEIGYSTYYDDDDYYRSADDPLYQTYNTISIPINELASILIKNGFIKNNSYTLAE